ncbi:hypothetical protein MIR68_008379 [Amoeboaphelidium protococcarum]|nr:hypothetical protein MIR68_008379 [Amoeboaphelidium protococcarum]
MFSRIIEQIKSFTANGRPVSQQKLEETIAVVSSGGFADDQDSDYVYKCLWTPISKKVSSRVLQAVVTKKAKQSTKVTRSIASMELRSQTPTQTDILTSKRSSSVQSSQNYQKQRK